MAHLADDGITRSIRLSTSLHYKSLTAFLAAGNGRPSLAGQSISGLDNGYGLQGNPSCQELQEQVAQLEGGQYSMLYPSGLTALTALAAVLKSGDHWLLPYGVYAPMRRFADNLQQLAGVTYDMYNPADLASLKKKLTPVTRMIHIESPCSATFETTDVQAIAEIAKPRAILVSADNTWASGVLCQPLALGADISVLSLTKYAGGYSDVFMGAVTTTDADLFKQFAYHHRVFGYTVSPFSAALVQRGLESMVVRLAAHGERAAQLVAHIKAKPQAPNVYYADHQSSPQLSAGNGLFSIELPRRYETHELEQPLAALQVFAIGESWGGTRSMTLPFQPEELGDRAMPPQGTILRFHAGLEDIDLMKSDIDQLIASFVQ
jgi:cystathionine beta-lyase